MRLVVLLLASHLLVAADTPALPTLAVIHYHEIQAGPEQAVTATKSILLEGPQLLTLAGTTYLVGTVPRVQPTRLRAEGMKVFLRFDQVYGIVGTDEVRRIGDLLPIVGNPLWTLSAEPRPAP